MNITIPLSSEDYPLFHDIINQGIDSHLEAFTESKFYRFGPQLIMDIADTEIPLLIRRLREHGTAEAEVWAEDIEIMAEVLA